MKEYMVASTAFFGRNLPGQRMDEQASLKSKAMVLNGIDKGNVVVSWTSGKDSCK